MNSRIAAHKRLAVACCFLIAACQADRTTESLFGPNGAGELVLDGLLIVGRPLPPVFVTQTVASVDRDRPRNAVVPGCRRGNTEWGTCLSVRAGSRCKSVSVFAARQFAGCIPGYEVCSGRNGNRQDGAGDDDHSRPVPGAGGRGSGCEDRRDSARD